MASIANSIAAARDVTALSAPASSSGANASEKKESTGSGAGQVATKEAFLKLLVAQIKNQNPLNPADGVQFLTQLAQFSELEQMMEIRADVEALRERMDAAHPADANQV